MSAEIATYDVDVAYLDSIMSLALAQRQMFRFLQLDLSSCKISYISTRGTTYLGIKEGYKDLLSRKEKGLKEAKKLRAGAKNYLRLIRNEDDDILQIESYKNGYLECIYQAHHVNNHRYLFPFTPDGIPYSTYTYVTHFKDGCVTEEYMVDDKQIVYESYTELHGKKLGYTYLNYVPEDHYPIRELLEGFFNLSSSTYTQTKFQCWLRDIPQKV